MIYNTREEDMVSMLPPSGSKMGLLLSRYPLPSADVKIVVESVISSDAAVKRKIRVTARAANFQQAAKDMVFCLLMPTKSDDETTTCTS